LSVLHGAIKVSFGWTKIDYLFFFHLAVCQAEPKNVPQPHDFEQLLALRSSQTRTLCEIVEDPDLNVKHIDGFEFMKYTHHNGVQSWEHRIFYIERILGTGHLVSLDGEGRGCMDEACKIID
jgi:hypothetical protein